MRISLLVVLFAAMVGTTAKADLPKNNLHLQDNIRGNSNVTEEQFNKISDAIIEMWKPMAAKHGATLVVEKRWKDSTVNAYATQKGNTWQVTMFGGLARRPEVTPDGFALVVCHELGHHFGGYYFYEGGGSAWASSEGQSDYFATQVCAKKVFSTFFDRRYMGRGDVPPSVKVPCDTVWKDAKTQSLCYRSAAGGLSLATLLATLGNSSAPKFETPDKSKVSTTNTAHPKAQCRLDTYFSGAVCAANFDVNVIPGKGLPAGQNSAEAEKIAGQHSCLQSPQMTLGYRPNCWFKPQTNGFRL